MKVTIKLDTPECMPQRAHSEDAGADLKAIKDYTVYPREVAKVHTGVRVKIPSGYAGFVFSRSGHGKIKVSLANSVGLIDKPYEGELICLVQNDGDVPYAIKAKDRIAQFVLVPVLIPEFVVFEGTDEEWLTSERGEKGFGSSGTD